MAHHHRRASRGARATAAGGATALLLGLGAAPAAAAGAGGDASFVPGTGTASATVERVSLRSSGASLSIGVGTAKARYAGAQGNAEAAGVDLGMLELASKAPVACGTAMGSFLPPGALPKRVQVSSGDGPSAERTASFGAGTPLEIGSQYGSARPNAVADAGVGGVTMVLPGLVNAVGGTARSVAALTPGRQRLAQAESSLGSLDLVGGLVHLEGLRWTAAHRTGTASDTAAAFSVGGMRISGQAFPTPDPASLAGGFARANAALAPLGLALHAPAVARGDRGVAVTPLRLSVTPTPALKAALVAALEGAQPARTELLKLLAPASVGEDCGLADAVGFGYLIADLALVVLGDQGGIDLDLGGATAGTQFVTYANPLLSGYGAIPASPALGGPAAAGSPPAAAAAIPGPSRYGDPAPPAGPAAAVIPGPSRYGSAPSAVAPGEAVAAPTALRDAAPTSWICRSTHAGDGCARRGGILAAWLALALIVVLVAADRLRSRAS